MNVKKIIKRHGYNQRGVAEKLGITESSLSVNITRGSMTATTLHRIADAIGADYNEFFEDEKPKKKHTIEVVLPDNAIDGGIIELGGQRYRQLFVPIEDVKFVNSDALSEKTIKNQLKQTDKNI